MIRDQGQRSVCLGYFGHMWELYAMWAWLSAFVAASWAAWRGSAAPDRGIQLSVFVAIGVCGLAGCIAGGLLADRWGCVQLTVGAMAVSGLCCLASAALYGAHPVLVGGLIVVWGFAVIADSAQFSAALSEITDTRYVGTALTAQTAFGFLITVASIRLIPQLASALGWRWALAPLAIGPFIGCIAMLGFHRERSRATRLATTG
jgi:MFS family permease